MSFCTIFSWIANAINIKKNGGGPGGRSPNWFIIFFFFVNIKIPIFWNGLKIFYFKSKPKCLKTPKIPTIPLSNRVLNGKKKLFFFQKSKLYVSSAVICSIYNEHEKPPSSKVTKRRGKKFLFHHFRRDSIFSYFWT